MYCIVKTAKLIKAIYEVGFGQCLSFLFNNFTLIKMLVGDKIIGFVNTVDQVVLDLSHYKFVIS